jgi:carbon storage regulator
MLVLTRRAGQALRIGESVEVQVIRVEGDRVVLGVVAPREVAIVRSELVAEVGAEVGQAAAARSQVLGLLRPRR